jgi:hypothetical protein
MHPDRQGAPDSQESFCHKFQRLYRLSHKLLNFLLNIGIFSIFRG